MAPLASSKDMFKDDQLQGHSGHGQAKSHTTQTTNGQKAASATAEVKASKFIEMNDIKHQAYETKSVASSKVLCKNDQLQGRHKHGKTKAHTIIREKNVSSTAKIKDVTIKFIKAKDSKDQAHKDFELHAVATENFTMQNATVMQETAPKKVVTQMKFFRKYRGNGKAYRDDIRRKHFLRRELTSMLDQD